MIAVDGNVWISARPAEVFEFVTNAENDTQWVSFAVSARKLSPGPVGLGTTFAQRGSVLGISIPIIWQITEFEPDRLMKGEATAGRARFWGAYALQQSSSGTRLRKSGRVDFSGFQF